MALSEKRKNPECSMGSSLRTAGSQADTPNVGLVVVSDETSLSRGRHSRRCTHSALVSSRCKSYVK